MNANISNRSITKSHCMIKSQESNAVKCSFWQHLARKGGSYTGPGGSLLSLYGLIVSLFAPSKIFDFVLSRSYQCVIETFKTDVWFLLKTSLSHPKPRVGIVLLNCITYDQVHDETLSSEYLFEKDRLHPAYKSFNIDQCKWPWQQWWLVINSILLFTPYAC